MNKFFLFITILFGTIQVNAQEQRAHIKDMKSAEALRVSPSMIVGDKLIEGPDASFQINSFQINYFPVEKTTMQEYVVQGNILNLASKHITLKNGDRLTIEIVSAIKNGQPVSLLGFELNVYELVNAQKMIQPEGSIK